MQNVNINQDMDAAAMSALKPMFEDLAAGVDDISLDLAGVGFMDSSGIGGIVFLYKRLRERSLDLTLANVTGQPLRLMAQLQLSFLIATNPDDVAA
ncbi:MAG: STAS domain-containing protein [Methylocystis sp.]